MKYLFILSFIALNLSVSEPINAQTAPLGNAAVPKNVIIMIADGMGFNHLTASYYYLYGTADSCIFNNNGFLSLSMATYSSQERRGRDTLWTHGYNVGEVKNNPASLSVRHTDSGAAGTAIASGKKTYNNAIGVGLNNEPLVNLVEAARFAGKATGIVTSVPISHATPAAFVAHNVSRKNYAEIAREMILYSGLDVLMGTGNPDYDNNALPSRQKYDYVGGEDLWKRLKSNITSNIYQDNLTALALTTPQGTPYPWRLIQDSAEFAGLLELNEPVRVLGIPKVFETLQQERPIDESKRRPFETPFNEGLPTLELMTAGALNVLAKNENGFFLMVEGGAVDWAAHSNQSDRLIEEMHDFLNAVKRVMAFIESESSWDETLLIVTSDHECGFLWGSGGIDRYRPIINRGKGVMPQMSWYSGDHTNSLVPFFAKGVAASYFNIFADETDPLHGPFIQNTEIAQLIFLLWGKP